MVSKLILGTVQFGIEYGITNSSGKTPESELGSIFNYAKQHGIAFLDTAQAYGDAESNIGRYADNQFEVISKFPFLETEEALFDSFYRTLGHLNKKELYGYMAHNAEFLLQYPLLWNTLKILKGYRKVKKIGYSLYTVEQLDHLLEMGMVPDVIQIPYSIFDRKFSSRFELLRSMNVEIHVRSVFLQGLYFMDPDNLPNKLLEMQKPLRKLRELCKLHHIDIANLALNYAILNPFIDKVVIGVNTLEQLRSNIEFLSNSSVLNDLIPEIESIEIKNPLLLNPALWN
jgi:aryl-alcohol dehydrogenase-like predicted oxidoreductase